MIHFGSFDAANLGDRLYPILLQRLAGIDAAIAGMQAIDWPEFKVSHIDDVISDDIMVGGGDLFARTSEYQGFMKLPAWPRCCREGFVLDREAVYFSVGCPSPINLSPAGWVWARDYRSAANLPEWPDVVAPDLAVLTSDALPKEPTRPVALVQFAYDHPDCVQLIRRLMRDYEVRLVSLTHYNGDAAAMGRAASILGLRVHVAESAFDLVREVSGASLVVASSMHANIVAFSFGVPHWFPPVPAMNKIPGFLEAVGLPQYLSAKRWEEIRPERSIVEPELLARAKRRSREALRLALAQTGRNIPLSLSGDALPVVVDPLKGSPIL